MGACAPRGGRGFRGRRRGESDRRACGLRRKLWTRQSAPHQGLFDCHRSRVPVLAIAAQTPSAELGAGYFQETHPENLFKALSGDGGFTMLMGDFLSLAQLGLPVKVVVFNNSALGFIEIEQKSTGFLDFGTEFKNPNFSAMA